MILLEPKNPGPRPNPGKFLPLKVGIEQLSWFFGIKKEKVKQLLRLDKKIKYIKFSYPTEEIQRALHPVFGVACTFCTGDEEQIDFVKVVLWGPTDGIEVRDFDCAGGEDFSEKFSSLTQDGK